MTLPDEISVLQAPLTALQYLLSHFNQQGIIGGDDAGFLGKPRLTVDIGQCLVSSLFYGRIS